MRLKLHNGIAELFFKIMWLLTVPLYLFIPYGSSFLNLIFYGIHGGTLLVFILSVSLSMSYGKINAFNGRRLFFLFALCVVLFFSAFTSQRTISFDVHIIGMLGFLEMLFTIYIIDRVEYTDSSETFIFWINIVTSFIFIFLSRTNLAYSGKLTDSLSLGYSNPNTTAIYLLMNIALLTLYTLRIKRVFLKFLVYALCTYLLYLLFETNSRTCLVAAIIIIAYILLAPKGRLPNALIPICLLLPLFFLFFYTGMYKSGKYADLTILGKPFFSGRESYFLEMLEDLKSYWLVGDVGLHPFENTHNGPLALMSSCGIVGYVLYLLFTSRTIRYYYGRTVTHTQSMALIVLVATFIHSSSEAALVVGGANFSIGIATFYWLLKGRSKNDEGLETHQ